MQDKSTDVQSKFQRIYTIPSRLVFMLGLPTSEFAWFIDAISWLIGLSLFLIIIYLLRGIVK